jgi:hypothetical protein
VVTRLCKARRWCVHTARRWRQSATDCRRPVAQSSWRRRIASRGWSARSCYHPLSGRVDASAFHLDAGRLCVALSRHRIVCFVFARAGIADLLRRYAPGGKRVLGIPTDPEYLGWRAHLTVLTALQKGGCVLAMP